MSNISHSNHNVSRSRRRRARIGAGGLVLALAIGLSPAAAQESIEDARDQREAAREEALAAQAAIDVLDAEYVEVLAAFEAADELVRRAEARAETVVMQLDVAKLRLARTEVAMAWIEHDRAILDEQLTDIAVEQYIGAAEDSSLLVEDDPTEAMVRNTFVGAVSGAGDELYDIARGAEEDLESMRADAEASLAAVQDLTEQLKAELAELEEAREVRQRARNQLDGRRQEWIDKKEDIEAEEARLTDFIRAEQQRIDTKSALDSARSAEGYVWPTEGGIGSYFGYRVHPILGYSRLHGGLDIGGKMGQPIWAAKEGVVILAGVKGGYGNTIVVDHGNGYATLYGHQTSFEVSVGQRVETGQHIGNVGSTGLSTGPHLHFEVRVNGGVVDPLPFLPPR